MSTRPNQTTLLEQKTSEIANYVSHELGDKALYVLIAIPQGGGMGFTASNMTKESLVDALNHTLEGVKDDLIADPDYVFPSRNADKLN